MTIECVHIQRPIASSVLSVVIYLPVQTEDHGGEKSAGPKLLSNPSLLCHE
jgi:hypothetical protein